MEAVKDARAVADELAEALALIVGGYEHDIGSPKCPAHFNRRYRCDCDWGTAQKALRAYRRLKA